MTEHRIFSPINQAPSVRPFAHLGPAYDDHHFTFDLGPDWDRKTIDRVISWAQANGIDPEMDSNLQAIRRNFTVGPVIVRMNSYNQAVAFYDMWLRNVDHL